MFKMDNRLVLNEIESVIIADSNRKRRPFGIDFQYNLVNAIAYLYDHAHITGYNDTQYLVPILLEHFCDSKMDGWPTPVKYNISNKNNVTMITVTKWNHKIVLGEFNCDLIIRVSYVYRVFTKNEFHLRIS